MKLIPLAPSIALAVLFSAGCGKKSADVAKQISELERKANEATERQKELERQIEDQKIAAERDAIERERMEIEQAREDLERRQDEAAAADAEKLRQREEALANREGKIELLQSTLEDKQKDLEQRDRQLSERDRELAGREAIDSDNGDDGDDAPTADYGMFHDSLSPYGSWFETADYGYVWQPVIVRDVSWRPYVRGRWVCTDRGWTWISDEPFGWATYHYGRWAFCHGYGWVWVPGCEWAPAWVSWRSSGSHIGWAPLPPETLAFRGGRCDSRVDVTFGIGSAWFNFVETRYFGNPIHHHCLPYTQNDIYFSGTVNITNIYVHNRRVICGGPRYWDVQRQTERKPPFYRIEEDRSGRPGRDPSGMRPLVKGDRLRVSAPNVDVAWNDGLKPPKVKGRIESLKVQRQQELNPEVADRFRKNREEGQRKAEQTITELGGSEKFNLGRQEQLATNRRRVEERQRQYPDKKDGKDRVREDQYVQRPDGPRIFPPRVDDARVKELNDRARKQREDTAVQTRTREETAGRQEQAVTRENVPNITPPREDRRRVQEDTASRIRQQQETLAEQNRQREETRRRQEQNANREDGPKVFPPRNDNRQVQDDSADRLRKRQEEQQAERTRQQQQEVQRQREQERQQQAEQARREQQREQARQQQMEEARREQQREQARQQQMEEARREQQREQARQQQMEEARREQQREQARQLQMEESRREQQRQQQEESQRQERNRQDQQRQEEDRRGRNR